MSLELFISIFEVTSLEFMYRISMKMKMKKDGSNLTLVNNQSLKFSLMFSISRDSVIVLLKISIGAVMQPRYFVCTKKHSETLKFVSLS